jgi:hypothetical protein
VSELTVVSEIDDAGRVNGDATATATATASTGSMRWGYAAVAVAFALVVAAAFVAAHAAADRSDARTALEQQRSVSRHARRTAADAATARDRVRADAAQLRLRLATPLATVDGLVQLADQGAAAADDAQRSGPGQTVADVDAYNEAVTRSNVVAEQFNAGVRRLDEQLNVAAGVRLATV